MLARVSEASRFAWYALRGQHRPTSSFWAPQELKPYCGRSLRLQRISAVPQSRRKTGWLGRRSRSQGREEPQLTEVIDANDRMALATAADLPVLNVADLDADPHGMF